MNDQLEFSGFPNSVGMVGRDHPDTSREAAEAVEPRTGTQRRRVYDLIRETGGCTDIDCQRVLGLDGNTERPRRVELVEAGLVRDSGERRRVNGRRMIIWRAV